MGVEGFVDLFSLFHLLLRAVVVAPTKEERVFHSETAESSVMITRRWKVFDEHYDTRPSHIHPLQVSKRKACGIGPSRQRNLRLPRIALPYLVTQVAASGKLGLQAPF